MDLIGRRFGKLTVMRKFDAYKDKRTTCQCKCDCGTTVYISADALLSGTAENCGCQRKPRTGFDLTGMKFVALTVIRPTGKRYKNSVIWECQCDCGNIIDVPASRLLRGDTECCGCLSAEELEKKSWDLRVENVNKLSEYMRGNRNPYKPVL